MSNPDFKDRDFRTDPNLSLEEKRKIAGDNYLQIAYELENTDKDIEEFVEKNRAKNKKELEEWFKQLENKNEEDERK